MIDGWTFQSFTTNHLNIRWSMVGHSNHRPVHSNNRQLMIGHSQSLAIEQYAHSNDWQLMVGYSNISCTINVSTLTVDCWWLDIPSHSCTSEHVHSNGQWLDISITHHWVATALEWLMVNGRKSLNKCTSEYHSLTKEGPLCIVCPSSSFASISCWGLKLTWKSAHLAQAL